MIEWLLFIYAVDTHNLIMAPYHRYQTIEYCKNDSITAFIPGKTYAICNPSLHKPRRAALISEKGTEQ